MAPREADGSSRLLFLRDVRASPSTRRYVEKLDDGWCRVYYSTDSQVPGWVPGFMKDQIVARHVQTGGPRRRPPCRLLGQRQKARGGSGAGEERPGPRFWRFANLRSGRRPTSPRLPRHTHTHTGQSCGQTLYLVGRRRVPESHGIVRGRRAPAAPRGQAGCEGGGGGLAAAEVCAARRPPRRRLGRKAARHRLSDGHEVAGRGRCTGCCEGLPSESPDHSRLVHLSSLLALFTSL